MKEVKAERSHQIAPNTIIHTVIDIYIYGYNN